MRTESLLTKLELINKSIRKAKRFKERRDVLEGWLKEASEQMDDLIEAVTKEVGKQK